MNVERFGCVLTEEQRENGSIGMVAWGWELGVRSTGMGVQGGV